MTSTITPALEAVPVAEGEPVPVPRPIGPTAGCAMLTLAALAVAVTDPSHPVWTGTALALAALTVGWGGGPVYRAALRRGGVTADTLSALGLLAVLGTVLVPRSRLVSDPTPRRSPRTAVARTRSNGPAAARPRWNGPPSARSADSPQSPQSSP